ncbi:MAG: hypothetical protein ACOC1I_04740, partial [Spirochaetota bacterium]
PTEYAQESFDEMTAEIESAVATNGAPLPLIAVFPVGYEVADGAITLAWEFGEEGDTFTVYANSTSAPLSCLVCTTIDAGTNRYAVDDNPGSGSTYRVVARNANGEVVGTSAEISIAVP